MVEAMHTLARLAGWSTVPDPGDHEVVRLALTRARRRHDVNRGADPAIAGELDSIEARWLEEAL